jgi:hypothetical protein
MGMNTPRMRLVPDTNMLPKDRLVALEAGYETHGQLAKGGGRLRLFALSLLWRSRPAGSRRRARVVERGVPTRRIGEWRPR